MKNNDVIQAIKSRISLADMARRYVELRPAGSRLVAPCPFHQETKPSFSINEEQGTFYCFGCQASGDIFDFYGRICNSLYNCSHILALSQKIRDTSVSQDGSTPIFYQYLLFAFSKASSR